MNDVMNPRESGVDDESEGLYQWCHLAIMLRTNQQLTLKIIVAD
jgi:hypothetical protein